MTLFIPTQKDRNILAIEYLNMANDVSDTTYEAWNTLSLESTKQAEILKSHFKIDYVEYEPYYKATEMFRDLENKTMKLSILCLEHPIYSERENINFRIAHDILGHWKMGTCHNIFSFKGEIQAFRSQARYIRNPLAKKALFTEVIGQASYRGEFGEFPEQKVGFII